MGWSEVHARQELVRRAAQAAAVGPERFARWAEAAVVGPHFGSVDEVVAALAWRWRQVLEVQLDDLLERHDHEHAWRRSIAAADAAWPGVAALTRARAAHPLVAAEAATATRHQLLALGLPGAAPATAPA